MSGKGVNPNSDPLICMVIGCGKKAIYRSASSARVSGSQRGYCSEHRALAVNASDRRQADEFSLWFSRKES
jgi:hypothetical protein